MGRGWTIGEIAGIRIRIDWSWLIIFVLVAWTAAIGYFPILFPGFSTAMYWALGIASSLLLFASVLVHELAHSFVSRSQGVPANSITLFLFGGVSQIEEEPRTAGNEFLMALVGPVTSLVLGALFGAGYLAIQPNSGPVAALLQYLAAVNLLLGAFNLVPAFPLDGGRVFQAIVWAITRNLRLATRIASWVGEAFAFLLIFLGIGLLFGGNFLNGLWLAFIGWFLFSAASSSYRELVIRQGLQGVPVRRLMDTHVNPVPPTLPVQQLIDEYILSGRQHDYPVATDGEVVGMITLDEVRNVPREQRAQTTVGQVMTPYDRLPTVSPEEDLSRAVNMLGQSGYEGVPVVDRPRHLVGLLWRQDIVDFLHTQSTVGNRQGG